MLSGNVAANAFNLRIAAAPNGDAAIAWDENSQYGKVRITEVGGTGGSGGPVPASDTIDSGGYEYSFFAPFACVSKPAPIRLRAGSRAIRKLAKTKRVRVVKVSFALGSRRATDRTRGFGASFPTDALDAGRHRVTASVLTERVGDGKRRTLRFEETVSICG